MKKNTHLKPTRTATLDAGASHEFKERMIQTYDSLPEPPGIDELRAMGGDWMTGLGISTVLEGTEPMTLAEIESALIDDVNAVRRQDDPTFDLNDKPVRRKIRKWLRKELKKGEKSAVRLGMDGKYTWIGPFGKPDQTSESPN